MWLPLDICQTNCSPCWMLPHRSSTCDACKNTWLHCFGNCTSYLYTSESSIGISLYARHSTSVSGRQPAVDISGGRLLPSTFCRLTNDASTINLSVNPRWPHISCGCNNECRTVFHHRAGLSPHYWHSCVRMTLTFSVSHSADRNLALFPLTDKLCNVSV